MRVVFDIDDAYADVISFTLIGHEGQFIHNVFASVVSLTEGKHLIKVHHVGNDVTKMQCATEKMDQEVPYEVLQKENEILENRLRHLLRSKTISMFDEKDRHTGEYVRDISRLDTYGVQYKLKKYEDKYNKF